MSSKGRQRNIHSLQQPASGGKHALLLPVWIQTQMTAVAAKNQEMTDYKRRGDPTTKLKISAGAYGLFCTTFDVGLYFFSGLADFSTIGKAWIHQTDTHEDKQGDARLNVANLNFNQYQKQTIMRSSSMEH